MTEKSHAKLREILLAVDKVQILRIEMIVAIAWSLFQLAPAVVGFFDLMILRPTHILLAVILGLMTYKGAQKPRQEGENISAFSWILILLAFTTLVYILVSYPRFLVRIPYVDSLTTWDMVFGVCVFLLILEGSRRVLGWVMPGLVLVCTLYAFVGKYLWGILAHNGVSLMSFTELQIFSTDGCFGIPTGVSADTVFYFILFGAFLEISGGTRLFVDLALKVLKGVQGGPGKVPIITSWLFGMISGSGAGNVSVCGTFTIPLMKKAGYDGEFAASVEATAGTGGQLMPPVMGAAAFVMASIVGVPYRDIAISGMIPGLLFYFGL